MLNPERMHLPGSDKMVSMETLHALITLSVIHFFPLEPALSEEDGSVLKVTTVAKAVTR